MVETHSQGDELLATRSAGYVGDLLASGEEFLWSNNDSKEKRDLGELWAARSRGQCLFVMPQGADFGVIGRKLY